MTQIARLGYLGFEVSDSALPQALVEWERFAVQVLGLAVAERAADGSLALRMDDQAWRIRLHPGERDDLAYVGFEVEDEAALRALVERLAAAGVAVEEAKPELCAARRVERMVQLADPNGVPVELFCGPARAAEPFRSELVPSGFVTGEEGLGHVVLVARDPEATERFYRELLGMRLTDWVDVEAAPGARMRVTFLHANPRHHTVAFAAMPLPKRIHHFMLEMGSMQDVGLACDRCLDAGFPLASMLGQHPNDRMFSFYATTPSGFDVEVGWGGRKVDDATWEPTTYDRKSLWGHRSPAAG